MKKYAVLIMVAVFLLTAETLFQVKDSSDRVVLDVSTDGLRVYNEGDLLMEISSSDIRAFIDNDPSKGLARSFSVTTSTNVKGQADVFEVTTDATQMREGNQGEKYTDFSPQNIFLGLNAGQNIDGAKYNVFIGNYSGYTTTGPEEPDMFEEGYYNTFLGYESGRNTISSFYNTYIGARSGKENPHGSDNTFVGTGTGERNTGSGNTFVGSYSAGFNPGNGYSNAFFGRFSGAYNSTGYNNVFLGAGAGESNQTGYNNVYLGRYAGGTNVSGHGNVFIGRSAGSNETGSNRLYIANTNTANPLIYGEFDNSVVEINGRLGVGVSPTRMLHVEDISVSNDNPAILGRHNVTDTYGVGVRGEGGARGVAGHAYATDDYHIHGVSGTASGSGGIRTGVYGSASGGTVNWAGFFSGNIRVTGNVTKSSDETIIDHPLDPKNKILSHSGVISDQMTSVYNGNVILDGSGSAKVQLPDWFEAMNTDFKYQLTAIGAPGPNLHIAKRINGNAFEIAGGSDGMEVSWQITAVRNDNFAKSNPVEVESKKRANEVGYYLHPESFGLGEEKSIERAMDRERVSR